MKVAVLGAGGHGQVIADALMANGSIELVGFYDDQTSLHGTTIMGIPVLGSIDARDKGDHDAVVVAIGDNALRLRLFDRLLELGEPMIPVVHPAAIVSRFAALGPNSVILAGAIVCVAARIESNVIVNTRASIDHHSIVEAHAHIGPGACIAGGCRVGEGALVGVGAVVVPNRTIGAGSIVGAGSVVVDDVPVGVVAYGCPARVIRLAGGTTTA